MASKKPTRSPNSSADPVTAYAREVVSGKRVAGLLVRLACKRHLDDLTTAPARGLVWCPGHPSKPGKPAPKRTAWHAFEFFRLLRFSKGDTAGQPFELEPWQKFIVGSVFGWRRTDGRRRFRMVYVQIARKNGKSELASGVGLYCLTADGEEGAEIYSAATMKEQARIVFETAQRMVRKSPSLSKIIGIYRNNLHVLATASKFEPLGADEDTMDGLNVHCALVDELHAHKSRGTWDVLETATGARSQPLMFGITTAGFIRGIAWELRGYCVKLLQGAALDRSTDATFAYVAEIDEGDDWMDQSCWPKANPNYGVSVQVDDMERLADKAKAIPGSQNNFRCKRLNQWVQQSVRWMSMPAWDECGDEIDPALLIGRRCFGGLDLSAKVDLCALSLVFPPIESDPMWRILPFFWCPEAKIAMVSGGHLVDRVPYDAWRDAGLLEQTQGDVVDHAVIRRRIVELGQKYKIVEIGFDSWNASQMAVWLQEDGFNLFEMRQGARTMSEPMKDLEALVLSGRIAHGANEVLRWMADNVNAKLDDNENIKPDKKNSSGKIDGIVATIMALGRANLQQQDPGALLEASILATRGVPTIG